MIKIALIGIVAVMLSISIKIVNSSYSFYISCAASLLIAYYGLLKAEKFIQIVEQLSGLLTGCEGYISVILKVSGITYIGEFSAGICKDAGYNSLAIQIEFALRLTILVISLPVLTNLLEMIGNNL